MGYERILKLLEREINKAPYRNALNKNKSFSSSNSNSNGMNSSDDVHNDMGHRDHSKSASKEDLTSLAALPSSSLSSLVADSSFDSFKNGGGNGSSISRKEDEIYAQEENIIQALSQARMLIVLDHIHGILAAGDNSVTDFKMFLSRLLDRCKQIKLLVSSTESLDMRNMVGNVVIENCLTLGPLTLHSSLRLFTRLSPCFPTPQSKTDFINLLIPPRQGDVTIQSRDLSPVAAQILFLFGNGHPAKIVKLAGDSDEEAVNALLRYGLMRQQAKSNTASPDVDRMKHDADGIISSNAPPVVIDKKGSI